MKNLPCIKTTTVTILTTVTRYIDKEKAAYFDYIKAKAIIVPKHTKYFKSKQANKCHDELKQLHIYAVNLNGKTRYLTVYGKEKTFLMSELSTKKKTAEYLEGLETIRQKGINNPFED